MGDRVSRPCAGRVLGLVGFAGLGTCCRQLELRRFCRVCARLLGFRDDHYQDQSGVCSPHLRTRTERIGGPHLTAGLGVSAAIPLLPSPWPQAGLHFTTEIARSARPHRYTRSTFPSAKATPARCSMTRRSSTSSHHLFRSALPTILESPAHREHAIRRARETPQKTAKNRCPLSYTNLFGYNRPHTIADGAQMNTRRIRKRNAPPRLTPLRPARRGRSS